MILLPIGDEPKLPGRPVITYILIGLNVAIFLLISLPLTLNGTYGDFLMEHGFKPADPSLFDLFTSMFLHAGWLHLGGNMLFLWIYGNNVELHIGRAGYIGIYLLTGVTAVALHALFRMDSTVPMVGASGAISGVLGCYFLWFPRNTVRVLFVFFFFFQIIRAPARLVLGLYLVVENLLPFVLSSSASSVAYGAHIGGFLGGLGSAGLVSFWARRRSVGEYKSQRASATVRPLSSTDAFNEAVADGNWPTALSLFTEMPMAERLALPEAPVLGLADWLVASSQLSAGLAVLQRFISTHPRSPLLARAHLRAGLIHLREQRLPAAHQHFLTVLDLDSATAEEIEGARAGLAEVERRQRGLRLH